MYITENKKKVGFFERLKNIILPTLLGLFLGVFIFNFVVMIGVIPSASMENTLMVGDRIFVNRLGVNFGMTPKHGQVVVFYKNDQDANGERILMVKRLIGKPGDTVRIEGGKVYRNDKLIIEDDYTTAETGVGRNGISTFEVPKNKFLLLGDNRPDSADARYWDEPYVDKEDLVGKAVVKFGLGQTEKPRLVKRYNKTQ